MASLQDEIDLLRQYQADAYVVAYTSLCFTILLYYDYALTLKDEVQYVWKERMSFGKLLFLVNRYLVPLDLTVQLLYYMSYSVGPKFCLNWLYVDASLVFVDVVVAQSTLILRTMAMWERRRSIVWFLSIFQGITISVTLAYVIMNCVAVKAIPKPLPFMFGCLIIEDKNRYKGVYAAPLALDTAVFVLTFIRGMQHKRISASGSIFHVLFRDGVMYFGIIFVLAFLNLVAFVVFPLQFAGLLFVPYRATLSIMVNRLTLNVRHTLFSERTLPPISSLASESHFRVPPSNRSKSNTHMHSAIDYESRGDLDQTTSGDIQMDALRSMKSEEGRPQVQRSLSALQQWPPSAKPPKSSTYF